MRLMKEVFMLVRLKWRALRAYVRVGYALDDALWFLAGLQTRVDRMRRTGRW